MKAIQKFTPEYLESCREMTPDQIARYLEDFRILYGSEKPQKSKLISMKVPVDLLSAFKAKATLHKTPYQTQIKALMRAWLVK